MYLIWLTFPYCYYMIWWIILQENLLQCSNAMQDIVIDGYESVFDMVSSSVTPVNVLDQQFSSTESERTNGTISGSSTSRSERDIKRRRIIGYCDNLTVQISRIQQCWWTWFHSINHRSIWEWHYLPQVMNRKEKRKKEVGEEVDISWIKQLLHISGFWHGPLTPFRLTQNWEQRREFLFLLFFLGTKQRQNITLDCRVQFCVSVLVLVTSVIVSVSFWQRNNNSMNNKTTISWEIKILLCTLLNVQRRCDIPIITVLTL